ncbi:hypothetical protein LACR_2137 [Lactococcus cremoris subsp. cremoris SK11]|uniref:Uncharacterized protein n=2 Tax=Lactococcus lactis subsp. cremoris TaxID=1359 RepID=Q02WR1_LACLS|nr:MULTISPECIES: hypothetical protein [Lactococcus]ABJ73611.1 hypothetical protein LACR_2137 [Lactococcus cremoris subsp. cremoris SK11]ARE24227.1 hypothetical protein LLJM3_2050 [Lactococcus cremoris]ARR86986.1 hypothetical protein BSR25_1172 [Lactococcus lactis subsp. lactis bv. diacetylactis]KZK48016.1 hypothetical protein SK110_0859 [Lactococcus cremoris]KZK54078.1 hypothetical protein AM2_1213 [Lactococcus cremoris]
MNWVNIMLIIAALYLCNAVMNFYNWWIVSNLLNRVSNYLKKVRKDDEIYSLGAKIDLYFNKDWEFQRITAEQSFKENLIVLSNNRIFLFDLTQHMHQKAIKMLNPINGVPAMLETIFTIPSRFIARIIPSAYSKIALRYFINFIFWLIGVLIAMFNSDIKNFITKLFFK